MKMKLAGEEERKIALEKGQFLDGIPYITVTGDAGWAKRTYGHGYNSASGVVNNIIYFSYRRERNKCNFFLF